MSRARRLSVAALVALLTLAAQWALWDWVDPYVWFLFYPAVFFCALLTGLEGGLVATSLSALLVWFVFIAPRFSGAAQRPSDIFSVLVFLLTGAAFSWVCERLRALQRHLAVCDLEERGHRYAEALQQSAQPVLVVDTQRRVSHVNAAFTRLTGFAPEDLLGQPVAQLVPDTEEARRTFGKVMEALDAAGVWEGELVRRTKSGALLRLYATVAGLTDLQGRKSGFVATYLDLRPLKDKMMALAESEARLQLLIDHAPVALALFDRDMRYLAVSRRWRKDYGLGERDVLGHGHYEVFPEIGAEWKAVHQRALRGEVVRAEEDRFVRADGSVQWLRWEVRPWQRSGDGVGGIVIFTEDITAQLQDKEELTDHRMHLERLIAERTEALHATHRQLADTQFAMERVGIGIHWVDPESGRFVYVNDYAAHMLGYSVEEMLGMSAPDIGPAYTAERLAAAARDFSQAEQNRFESVHRTRDGRHLPVEITLYYLAADKERPARLVTFVTDITQRRAAQEDLKLAKSAAEAANLAKSAFLANMSHEIRTPMNAVLGFTHMLRQHSPRPEQEEYLAKIQTAAEHLLSIISDILDLAKIEAGKMELEQTDFSLPSLMDNVRSLVGDAVRAKGLRIEVDCADVPHNLLGDPRRLRQALLNYTNNAVKFTERGSVALRARLLERHAQGEMLLRFEVQDTGIGIAPERVAVLFNAFEQVDQSITRRYGGTGLGLAITRQFARLMGGSAGVETVPGQGSLFWFTARLRCGAEPQAVLPTSVLGDGAQQLRSGRAGMRVLLVEDDPINREVAEAMLAATGLALAVVSDGAQAVEWVRAQGCDLVLMDVQMPRMDGMEATRAIRQMPGRASLPVLAMTANAYEHDRARCMAAGMNDVIVKPVDPQLLYGALLRWLPRAPDADGASPPSAPRE